MIKIITGKKNAEVLKFSDMKRSLLPLIFLFLIVLISGCLLGPIIEELQDKKPWYHITVTRVPSSENVTDPIGNLTASDLIDSPILLEVLETMVTNETIMEFSSDITEEEANILIEVFEDNGMPIGEYPQQYFYYTMVLFYIDLIIAVE